MLLVNLFNVYVCVFATDRIMGSAPMYFYIALQASRVEVLNPVPISPTLLPPYIMSYPNKGKSAKNKKTKKNLSIDRTCNNYTFTESFFCCLH